MARKKKWVAIGGWSYGDQFGLAGDVIPDELVKHFQWAIESGEVVEASDAPPVVDAAIDSEVVDIPVIVDEPTESQGE